MAAIQSTRTLSLYLLLLLCGLLLFSACGGDDYDPKSPEGALQIFLEGIKEKDSQKVWQQLDRDTKLFFRSRLTLLVAIERDIYLNFEDKEEQSDLLNKTGIDLLGKMRERANTEFKAGKRKDPNPTPMDLFMMTIRPQNLVIGDTQDVGLKIDDVDIDGDEATIVTQQQIFHLSRDAKKRWGIRRSSPAFLVLDKVSKKEEIEESLNDALDESSEAERKEKSRLLIVQGSLNGGDHADHFTYYMKRTEGHWQVKGASGAFLRDKDGEEVVVIDIFALALMPLQNSKKALSQFSEGRKAEERDRRRRLIDYFHKMEVKAP